MIRYFEKSTEPGINVFIKFGRKYFRDYRLSSQYEEFLTFLYNDLGTDKPLEIIIQLDYADYQPYGWAEFNMRITLFAGNMMRFFKKNPKLNNDKYGSLERGFFWVMAHEFGHIEHRLIDPNSWNTGKYAKRTGEIGKDRFTTDYIENYANAHADLKLSQFDAKYMVKSATEIEDYRRILIEG